MCGRGYMDESKGDLKPVDNTFLLTPALKWEIASNPFNKYSSVRNDISVQQISPSYGFAHYLSRHIHSKIGMIVNGRGGHLYPNGQKVAASDFMRLLSSVRKKHKNGEE